MEEKKEKQKPQKMDLNLISKEELKAKSRSLLTVFEVGIVLWALPHVISALAATVRSFKDFKKACKG